MANRTIEQEIFSSRDDALSTLAAAFPEAVKDGEVDWKALETIFKDTPSTGAEKYELTWAGKAEAKREAGRDAVGRTLRFCPEESKDAGTTQNLYIEGDNLEVLKLLRENYYGAVKMIYIDPPYNTGNDFVYRDNFTQSEMESDLAEGNIDAEGERLRINPKTNNRYHATWLSMMYSRLRLARDLLTQNGVIFISIDDNEIHNTRKICDEIFGEDNFIATIVWKHTQQSKNDELHFSRQFNYIVLYARNILSLEEFHFPRTDNDNRNYSNPDDDPKGMWRAGDVRSPNFRKTLRYDLIAPNGAIISPPMTGWRWSKETMEQKISSGEIVFKKDNSGILRKIYLSNQDGRTPENLWAGEMFGTTRQATNAIKELFEGDIVFDTPKPVELICRIIQLSTSKNSLVVDFFSGSATAAHAVMKMNAEDGGERRFICVQLPEKVQNQNDIQSTRYHTISDIGKERIRRAGEKIALEFSRDNLSLDLFNSSSAFQLDVGFKVFKTADTVIRWTHDALRPEKQKVLAEARMTDKDRLDFMPGFTDIDVVYEIALRQNDIPLSSPVRPVPKAGKRTYIFADSILVCLEESITPELINALADIQPTPNKFVLRDSAFEDDIALKDETLRRLQALVARNTKDAKPTYVVDFI